VFLVIVEEQYMTPTQRKNKEIAGLKKQLKAALKSLEEKETVINEYQNSTNPSASSETLINENRKLQVCFNIYFI